MIVDSGEMPPKYSERWISDKEYVQKIRSLYELLQSETEVDEVLLRIYENKKENYADWKTVTHDELTLLSIKVPQVEDNMIKESELRRIKKRVGYDWDVDMCCNYTGSNATSRLYYDASTDCTKQARSIGGYYIWVNPSYINPTEVIKMRREAFRLNSKTRLLYLLP